MYLDGTTVKYEAFSDGRRFTYMYDAMGLLYAVRLATYSNPSASAIYYYVYNLQGDVIALVNSANGQIVARYEYDAWGKITAITDANGNAITDQSHIAHVNPFRYRGYYYDNETGLYYLNSRYYDPDTCRFINSDSQFDTGAGVLAYNIISYCANNPIKYKDVTGTVIVLTIELFSSNPGAIAIPYKGTGFLRWVSQGLHKFGENIKTLPKEIPTTVEFYPPVAAPFDQTLDKAESKAKEKPVSTVKTEDRKPQSKTYFHVTSKMNAAAIIATNVIMPGELGLVYAWRLLPDKKAIKESGAYYVEGYVIVMFQTYAVFSNDVTVSPYAQIYQPVSTYTPGSIIVQNPIIL